MAFNGLEEVRIHDLGRLLELLRDAGVELPPDADYVDELTMDAVPMRYDELLDAEPLERDAAVALVGEVGESGQPPNSAETWSRNWSPTPPNSAEILGRDSLYRARFGSIDGFRRDS